MRRAGARAITLFILLAGFWVPGVAADQAMAPEVTVSIASPDERWVDVAYDFNHDEYLVVWGEDFPPAPNGIHARLLDRHGFPKGAAFDVAPPGGHARRNPAVAYDGEGDRFLVVYEYDYNGDGSDWDIYGRFLNWSGVFPGWDEFVVEDTTHDEQRPAVAFSWVSEKFLVTWDDWDSDYWKVQGALVAFGALEPSFTVASHSSEHRWFSDIAWEPFGNKFLVVYDNTFDVLGKLVTTTGSMGSEITVAGWPAAETRPAVASCENWQFLVVWESYNDTVDPPNEDVYGRFLQGDGSFWQDPKSFGSLLGRDVRPDVACMSGGVDYLVVWEALTAPRELVGKRLLATGALGNGVFVSQPADPLEDFYAAVAGSESGWLVGWLRQISGLPANVFARVAWELFADGFEWGNTGNWSATAP